MPAWSRVPWKRTWRRTGRGRRASMAWPTVRPPVTSRGVSPPTNSNRTLGMVGRYQRDRLGPLEHALARLEPAHVHDTARGPRGVVTFPRRGLSARVRDHAHLPGREGVAGDGFVSHEPAGTEDGVGLGDRIRLERRRGRIVDHGRVPGVGGEDALRGRMQVHHARGPARRAEVERSAQLQVVERGLPLLRLDHVDAVPLDELFGQQRRLPGKCLRGVGRGQQRRRHLRVVGPSREGPRVGPLIVERDAVHDQPAIHQ